MPTEPKKLPTLRDSGSKEQLDVFQRDVREVLRRLWDTEAADVLSLTTGLSTLSSEVAALVTGVSSVTAGSSMVTVSPTTGAVVVNVVPGNFTGIPESGISGLVSDLSARPTGSGTANKLSKWLTSTSLGNSSVTDTGALVTVANPLTVTGATTLSLMTAGSVLFAGTSGLVSQNNANLFWDDTNNRLGIKTNTPAVPLHVVGDSAVMSGAFFVGTTAKTKTNFAPGWELTSAADVDAIISTYSATGRSQLMLYRGRGTAAATTALLSGDNMGQIGFTGATGSSGANFFSSCLIRGAATENFDTSTHFGGKLEFHTTANNSASAGRAVRLTIDHDGTSTFANALIGSSTLTIAGDSTLTGKLLVRGGNTNTAPTPLAGFESHWGRSNAGATVSTGASDFAFNWGGSGGGFRHWLTTEHSNGATSNRFRFWLNNSATASASTAPGTNNVNVFTLTNAGAEITSNASADAVVVQNNSTSGFSSVLFKDSSAANKGAVGYGNASAADSAAAGRFYWHALGGADTVWLVGSGIPSTPALTMFNATQNVNIGPSQTDPGMRLQVEGATYITTYLGVGATNTSGNHVIWAQRSGQANITLVSASGTQAYTGYTIRNGSGERWYIGLDGTGSTDGLILRRAAASNDVKIDTSGNITLGAGSSAAVSHPGTISVTGLSTLTGGFTLGADSSANSHKITSLTNGSASSDAAAFGQLAAAVNAAVSGTANTTAKFTGTNVASSGFPTSLTSGLPGSAYVVHPGSNWGLVVTRPTNDTGAANITLYKTRATDASTKTATANGDALGRLIFAGATSGTTVINGAQIQAVVQGAVSDGVLPTDLIFYTTAAGTSAEVMRVTNGGTVAITGALTVSGNASLGDGTGDTLKFYGGTGATQQTITGSRGGNAALADLLTKLATLGLIVDSTTA